MEEESKEESEEDSAIENWKDARLKKLEEFSKNLLKNNKNEDRPMQTGFG